MAGVDTDDGQTWSDLASATDPTLTFTASLDQDGNRYRAVFASAAGRTVSAAASLTVARIALTVTASSATMTYGGAVPSVGPRYSGLAAGDTVDAVVLERPRCSSGAGPSSPVGSYPTRCDGGAFAPDYAVTYRSGRVSVLPAVLTVTASDVSQVYGQAPPQVTPRYTGFVAGDDVTSLTHPATCVAATSTTTETGTYATTCSGARDPDYEVRHLPGTVTVTPAPQTIVSTTAVPRHPATRTTLRLSATPGASGTPVSYAVDATSGAGACRLRGDSAVRLTGLGTCVVALSQAASRNHQAATAQLTIVVDTAAPAWRSPRLLRQGRVGSRYAVGLRLTGTPQARVRLEQGALPPGLSLRPRTSRLVGKPTRAGRFTFVLSATNRAGSTTRTFVVRVARSPHPAAIS